MTELVALRPKLYACKTFGGRGCKKCRRAKKCVVKKKLNFNDYKQYLLLGQHEFRKQFLFQNKLHEVHTIKVNKLALSRKDDKQVVQSDGISTLAYGHKNLASDIGLE